MSIDHSTQSFSIVLPCYNEAHRIGTSLPELFEWRHNFELKNKCTVNVFLASDGCTDNTLALAREISIEEKKFSIVGYEKNKGRGAVLKHSFQLTPSDSLFVLYMDADLATDLKHVQDVYDLFIHNPSNLLVCGNRYFPESKLKRPLLRKIWSWGWRSFVCILFMQKMPDTQCGFKAISRSLIDKTVSQLQIPGFVADVEIILRAQKNKAEIKEINIDWIEKKGSTIRWSTVFKMFGEMLKLKLNQRTWIS